MFEMPRTIMRVYHLLMSRSEGVFISMTFLAVRSGDCRSDPGPHSLANTMMSRLVATYEESRRLEQDSIEIVPIYHFPILHLPP
jgi:hypothetical protein